ALHLGLERAAHTAVGAGGDHAVLGLAEFDHALFHQRRGRAGLHAGAAGHALGIHEVFVLACRDTRLETAAIHRQREGALRLFASTHAAVAHDALGGVVAEVRVGLVLDVLQVVLAFVAVAHFTQAD